MAQMEASPARGRSALTLPAIALAATLAGQLVGWASLVLTSMNDHVDAAIATFLVSSTIGVAAFVLAVVALVRARRQPGRGARALAIASLALAPIGGFVLAFVVLFFFAAAFSNGGA
jgi:hypothetical protein